MTNRPIADRKAVLRRQVLQRRDALSDAEREKSSRRIAWRLSALMRKWAPGCVAAYAPIRSEANVLRVLAGAGDLDIATALPAVSDGEMLFRQWRPGEALTQAAFGVREPSVLALVVIPDVIFLPVAGFDRHGGRLGYGNGFYDRAIARLAAAGFNPRPVGIAFSVQEVERIPVEPHDVALDHIVTENEVLGFGDRRSLAPAR